MPEQRESAESGGSALAVAPRGTIVIVDDDSEVRTCHLAICERNGYGAHAFDNGHDALSFLGEQDVDIVLTDIRMPGMDGMELLDRILALDAEIPVILMTAFADIDMAIAAVTKGAFDFILKPFDADYLLKALDKGVAYRNRLISEKRYREELELAVEKRAEELRKAHEAMLQSEKMALVGQIAAGVAHEINNPVGFISSNLESLGKYVGRLLDFIAAQSESLERYCPREERDRIEALHKKARLDIIMDDLPLLLEESRDGIDRIAGIVRNLKSFSRADGNEFLSADINAAMETALNLARNELKYVATLTTEYGDLPPTRCLINQLIQVFMNLLVNAAHAIQGRGEIRVRTWHGGDAIHVAISDTGCGIPEGIRDRIFEPFFTTKEIGTGTGLGLSICQDIIGKHNGRITVESSEGLGTTFMVSLPVVA